MILTTDLTTNCAKNRWQLFVAYGGGGIVKTFEAPPVSSRFVLLIFLLNAAMSDDL